MVTTRFIQILTVTLSFILIPTLPFASDVLEEKNRILHFDQPQAPLTSLNFKQNETLKPLPNDFRIIEISYLSNDVGERWAIVTFENKSKGQRLLKNKSIVATFADGHQSHALNLDETIKGREKLSKAVFFGAYQFPILAVKIE